jgi:hypothetical protein
METQTKEGVTETPVDNIIANAKPITAEELVAPMAANMPLPTGSVDDFPAEPPKIPGTDQQEFNTEGFTVQPEIRDDEGNVFDPNIFKTGDDGKPLLKNGRFVRLKRGRPAGSTTSAPTGETSSAPKLSTATSADGVPDQYDNAAALYFDMSTGLACGFISDEFKPDSDAERAGMIRAVAAYLRAKGSVEVTPGQALAFACVAYVGARLGRPKTSDKLKLWALKVRDFFKKPQQVK